MDVLRRRSEPQPMHDISPCSGGVRPGGQAWTHGGFPCDTAIPGPLSRRDPWRTQCHEGLLTGSDL